MGTDQPLTHRPWFKVAINTVLRFFQTRKRPAELWVMYSLFDGISTDPNAKCVGYRFGWVYHMPSDWYA